MTALATITEWDREAGTPAQKGISLAVQFNPKSLALSYTPTGTPGGKDSSSSGTVSKQPSQQTGELTSLTADLIFDTTTDGTSVLDQTKPLVDLTQPDKLGKTPPPRKVVRFLWGNFTFYGTISQLSQTLTFFSDDGKPLRADIHLALSEVAMKDPTSDAGSGVGLNGAAGASTPAPPFGAGAGVGTGPRVGASPGAGTSPEDAPSAGPGTVPLSFSQAGDSVAAIAARAGSAVSWKTIAAANGIDNPRLLQPGTVLDTTATLNLS